MVSTGNANRPLATLPPTNILTFHRVSSRFTWGATNLTPRRLFDLMHFLLRQGFVFANKQNRGEKAIRISFDDGYEELLDIIPKLIEVCSAAPIVFIPTAFIGQSNSWDYSSNIAATRHLDKTQIQKLSDLGVSFGGHGHSHCDLTQLGHKKLTLELSNSRKILENITGRPVTDLSYPFGRVNQVVVQAAIEVGYVSGFTMRFPRCSDLALQQGRMAVYGFDTNLSVSRKLGSGLFRRLEEYKARTMNACSAGTTILKRTTEKLQKSRQFF